MYTLNTRYYYRVIRTNYLGSWRYLGSLLCIRMTYHARIVSQTHTRTHSIWTYWLTIKYIIGRWEPRWWFCIVLLKILVNQQDSLSLHLRIKSSIIHLYIQTDCGTPTIDFGSVDTSSSGTEYQAVATVTCNTGYTQSGDKLMECLDTGIWSTGHTCTIKGKWRWCSSCRNSDYKSCVSHYANIDGKT